MKRVLDPDAILTGLDDWPDKWHGVPADVAVGRRLIEAMRPFVAAIMSEGLAAGTVHRHLNSLWLLGGQIVAKAQQDSAFRRFDGRQLLVQFIDEQGGPVSRDLTTEDEHRRFDSMCRKLYRFLTAGRAA